MVAEISWHKYGTKLHQRHPMYICADNERHSKSLQTAPRLSHSLFSRMGLPWNANRAEGACWSTNWWCFVDCAWAPWQRSLLLSFFFAVRCCHLCWGWWWVIYHNLVFFLNNSISPNFWSVWFFKWTVWSQSLYYGWLSGIKGKSFFWLLLYWLLFCNLLYRCAHVKDVRKLSYFEYLKVMKYICYLFVLLSAACYCVHVLLRYWFR